MPRRWTRPCAGPPRTPPTKSTSLRCPMMRRHYGLGMGVSSPVSSKRRLALDPSRNLDDEVKTRLRVRAANNGRSMEEEVRLILREASDRKPSPQRAWARPSTNCSSPSVGLSWSCRTARRCASCPASIEMARDGGTRYECGVRNDARFPTSGTGIEVIDPWAEA